MTTSNPNEQAVDILQAQPENIVFSLDIGTRSVIGVVGIQEEEKFKIIDTERIEHSKRAMMDGQIEDIEQVGKIIALVKGNLEKRIGYKLERVAIAAAGRALRTKKVLIAKELDGQTPIDKDFVMAMELEAIQTAQEELDRAIDEAVSTIPFYCVGHTVTKQILDKYPISNLVGHKGKEIELELIATFLPSTVVESLYSTMELNALTISSLTLEPIAAINVLIPTELRMLNLALVDIGAGTSDIAVSKDGAISAYAMATIAGDEITEAIIKGCLVDFETAEKVKQSLSLDGFEVTYKDILGVSHTKKKEDIFRQIASAVEHLCDTICDKIVEINAESPSAVFLVGGGSLVPTLCDLVANRLDIEPARVAVGNQNFLRSIVVTTANVDGPEYITPIGIAVTSVLQNGYDFYSITLNNEKVKIFNNKNLTVSDVMVMSGYRSHQLIGLSGRSVTFELNGEKRIVRGELSKPGAVFLNDEPVSINANVRAGDRIEVVSAVNGASAQVKLVDLIDTQAMGTVILMGNSIQIGTIVTVNGEEKGLDYQVENYDVVETMPNIILGEVLKRADIQIEGYFTINDEPASLDTILKDNDVIDQVFGEIPVEENTLPDDFISVTINDVIQLISTKEDGSPNIFVDALNYVDIDPSKPEGELVLLINNRPASYTEMIKDGDVIQIGWKR